MHTMLVMANNGGTESDGDAFSSDEVYSGRTRITTTQSEQSEQSGPNSECMSPKGWAFPSRLGATCFTFDGRKIYHDHEDTSSSSSTPLSLPPAEDRPPSSGTPYSWPNLYDSFSPMEDLHNRIPSLDLNSNQASTLDYMRDLDTLKLSREPQVAFETWYSAKRRLRQQEIQRLKEKQEKELEAKMRRKQESKICYEQWLHNKTQQASQQRLDNHIQSMALQAAASSMSKRYSSSSRTARNISQDEIRQVVQDWWLKKQSQKQLQQQEKQRRVIQKAQQDQQRKRLAEKAWKKWMSNVYEKPKPVPMNQGIDSLRGSISQMYCNPLPWKPLKNVKEKS